MKRFIAILCVLLLLAGLSGCGQNEELAAENEQLRQALESAEADKAALEDELAAAREHADMLQDNLSELWGKYYDVSDELKAAQESKWKTAVCTMLDKDMDGAIFHGSLVYMEPWADAEVKGLRDMQYVEVVAKAELMDAFTGETADWYIVRFAELSDPGMPFVNFAWAPAEMLEEYTYENMKEIVGPVKVREGAVIYTDEQLTQRPNYEVYVGNCSVMDLGNGICMISVAGYGSPFYVRASDVIYPTP